MGQIFVMGGGSDFRKILSSCEIYDPGVDKWFHGKGNSTFWYFFFQTVNTQSLSLSLQSPCADQQVGTPVIDYPSVKFSPSVGQGKALKPLTN